MKELLGREEKGKKVAKAKERKGRERKKSKSLEEGTK